MVTKGHTVVNHIQESSTFAMSQPNQDNHVLPMIPTSPSTSVSSYLARMESAINPAASANVDSLATNKSVSSSHKKHHDIDEIHGNNVAKDVMSSVVVDDHLFNGRDDEDDGAMVLHRSVESLGSAGYLSTVQDDTHHRHHRADEGFDVVSSYPSSTQIMAAVRDVGNNNNSSIVIPQITPPTWVSYLKSIRTLLLIDEPHPQSLPSNSDLN